MSSSTAELRPRVLSATPGRLRVHLSGWGGEDAEALARRMVAIPGVTQAQARASTHNALIGFDRTSTTLDALLDRLGALLSASSGPPMDAPTSTGGRRGEPPAGRSGSRSEAAERESEDGSRTRPLGSISGVLREGAGRFGRARIAVRGLDRDPQLSRRVVEALERRPEVKRVVVSAATGRVLVEFSSRVTDLQDLLAQVSRLELPDLPGDDRPGHPLDPAPLLQSGSRLAGSLAGLALLGARQLMGAPSAPLSSSAPATVAGTVGILEGIPPVRDGLRQALGRDRAQLLLSGTAIVSLTLSGSPLGLALTGAGALRLLTEVRARRTSWRDYEQRLGDAAASHPGAVVRLEAGERVPLRARTIEGTATATGRDGLPHALVAGADVQAGARLLSGRVVAELVGDRAFTPQPRPAAPRPDVLERYLGLVGPLSLAYAGLSVVLRRSLPSAFTALLLVNPRAALIGSEAADTGASARVLRAGVTVVGTRPERVLRCPDVLLIDGPRTLSDGLEMSRILPLGGADREQVAAWAAGIAAASGSPWGPALRGPHAIAADDGNFDGTTASATVSGQRYALVAAGETWAEHAAVRRTKDAGEEALVLLGPQQHDEPLAVIGLRPRVAAGASELVRACREHGCEITVLERGDRRASRALARRVDVSLVVEADLVELVRDRQRGGDRVALLSDSAAAAEAFEACDLAIGLTSGRSARFSARADLMAPDLSAVAAVIEAGARRDASSNASVGLSLGANVLGGAWGLQGAPGLERASYATYAAALSAIGVGWQRLRGGRRSHSLVARLTDPRPERWGRLREEVVLQALDSRTEGLTGAEVAQRHGRPPASARRNPLLSAVSEQLQSPLTGVLAAGGALSLVLGAPADVVMIGAVIVANVLVGSWQERQAGRAAEALEQIGAITARVVRDGQTVEVAAHEVVTGDILLVASGDRVVADARLLEAAALEVDEASLTGESLPVSKGPHAEPHGARVVLEGSDVTVGSGRAVVAAVGEGTRLGATAAALAIDETRESPLGQRLNDLFRRGLPLIVGAGALVTLSGIAWGGAPLGQLALGASIAVAAVPEGLPLLAGVASAAVGRRLAGRNALLRRLAAVESLGRVDVACADKTGTLTQGHLAVSHVDSLDAIVRLPAGMGDRPRHVLEVAALASPRPDGPQASAHPTDGAVLDAAASAGLSERLTDERTAEAPFDPARSFHATVLSGAVCVKGAAETIVPRCVAVRRARGDEPLDDRARDVLLRRAEELGGQGLRVLMVAEGPAPRSAEDPQDLIAVGFLGISDPLRAGVKEAVARCKAAGVRVVMLTGDHAATARAIAADAGLDADDDSVISGDELSELDNGELDRRLESASVVARITPLDKLRIVESMQRSGHTVAMTGDGVNDAPALRLADVGVAMGAGGTEVARQAADLVLADDDFATLVEALVEGRAFWENLRRALGLLLGGNLGELGLIAIASVLGRTSPLTTRQILAVNLVTDVLPAVAVAVQPPEHRDLSVLARERPDDFDAPLRRDILRRGAATALPALGAFLAMGAGGPAQTVAFASIVVTQLAQTLDAGRSEGRVSPSVAGAIAGSGALLAATLTVAPMRAFLGLAAPTPAAAGLIVLTAPAAVLLSRALQREGPGAMRLLPAG